MSASPTPTLNRDQLEFLELIASELHEQLEAAVAAANTPLGERLLLLAEMNEHIGQTAAAVGMPGLARVFTQLNDNFTALVGVAPEPASALLVDAWFVCLLDYIQALVEGRLDHQCVAGLLEFLADPAWPTPLSDDECRQLAPLLLAATTGDATAPETTRSLPRKAEPSLLSLTLGDDLNPDLFEGLMIELPGQVSGFAEQIDILVTERQIPSQSQALAHARRIAHTLKGSANVVGISGLANFMHFSEDLLDLLAREGQPLPQPINALLVDMADTLASLTDSLMDGTPAGDNELSIMQQILDHYHQLSGSSPSDIGEETDPLPQTTTAPETPEVVTTQPTPEPARAQLQETLSSQLRVKEETAQELLRLAGESTIGTNRLLNQASHIRQQLQLIGQLHQKLNHLSEEFGQLIEVRNLFSDRGKYARDGELDPLELDHYNELHSFFHQLQELELDTRDAIEQTHTQVRELEELAIEQQQSQRKSHGHLLEMRMVPAGTMEARFTRCVRQACRLTGKQAQLTLEGADTLIDSPLLYDLVDPLMHLLRNAVDHGIESAQARLANGKPEAGHIVLSFANRGQTIQVQLRDDGAGLDRQRIVRRATELGALPQDDSEVDEQWLQQLIFSSGFSTRSQISQTSGRGIGLDVAAEAIGRLNGRITLDSEPGQGCTFTLQLPLTVIAEHQLLVCSGSHQLAIASRGVQQLLYLNDGELRSEGDQLFYAHAGGDIRVHHLAHLAQLPDAQIPETSHARALLLVEQPSRQLGGILLEQVLASREMVVKPLSPFTPSPPGVIGATVLGDGRVAPVVDIQQMLIEHLKTSQGQRDWLAKIAQQQSTLPQRPLALVVDDSLSTRRSLAQLVSDIGMDVRTAKDGFEAIDILQEVSPSVLLVDMEMPRMNGLELTAHVRALDNTRHIPVIMITSRNTDKHRRLASDAGVDTYLNKPFSEDELMQHIQRSMEQCTAYPATA